MGVLGVTEERNSRFGDDLPVFLSAYIAAGAKKRNPFTIFSGSSKSQPTPSGLSSHPRSVPLWRSSALPHSKDAFVRAHILQARMHAVDNTYHAGLLPGWVGGIVTYSPLRACCHISVAAPCRVSFTEHMISQFRQTIKEVPNLPRRSDSCCTPIQSSNDSLLWGGVTVRKFSIREVSTLVVDM